MNENKRYSFNWEREHPNFWDNYCDLADCYLTCEDVCELLNELHEENQMLKEQYAEDCNEANSLTVKIAELKEELSDVRYDYAMLEVEHSKAKSENEQLKQDRFICLDCKHSGYTEIGCLCEKKDHWTDYKTECKNYEELE